jgi:hypothetical protein
LITILSGQEYAAYEGQTEGLLAAGQEEVVQVDLAIGNYIPTADPRTLGFWHNKNGKAEIQRMIGEGIDVYAELSALNLRNQDGSNFDPTNFNELSRWLIRGKAKNMANMLSVQLAAMKLNVLAGFVSEGMGISVCGYTGTIGSLIDDANYLLGQKGVIGKQDPDRSYAAMLECALDSGNNNSFDVCINSETLSLLGLDITHFSVVNNLLSII